jgi:hypothetical protein
MATWLFEPGHTAAMFRARHVMVTYVRGHFKNVSGSLVFDPEHPAQSSGARANEPQKPALLDNMTTKGRHFWRPLSL